LQHDPLRSLPSCDHEQRDRFRIGLWGDVRQDHHGREAEAPARDREAR
jgi:hypothetical protein